MRTYARLRLARVKPHRVARWALGALHAELAMRAAGLGPTATRPAPRPARLEDAPAYELAFSVCSYAVHGEPSLTRVTYEQAVRDLSRWLGERTVVQAEPDNELALCVVAVEARLRLLARGELTSMQIAVLTGLDRDSVNARAAEIPGAYRSDENRHRPWRFVASEELEAWIEEHA